MIIRCSAASPRPAPTRRGLGVQEMKKFVFILLVSCCKPQHPARLELTFTDSTTAVVYAAEFEFEDNTLVVWDKQMHGCYSSDFTKYTGIHSIKPIK